MIRLAIAHACIRRMRNCIGGNIRVGQIVMNRRVVRMRKVIMHGRLSMIMRMGLHTVSGIDALSLFGMVGRTARRLDDRCCCLYRQGDGNEP